MLQLKGQNLLVSSHHLYIASIISNVAIIKLSISCSAALPTYRIVGDNVDVRLHPRHQTLTRRDQDHHWFHMYAIKDRVVGLHLADDRPITEIAKLPLSAFLLNMKDCRCLHREFTILMARVLVKYLPCFLFLQAVVPDHIPHQFSDVMNKKSETV